MQPPYNPPPQYNMQPPYYQPPQPPPAKSGRGLQSVLFVLLLIVVAGVALQSVLFRVNHIEVTGCVNMTQQEVIDCSGLFIGQNMLSINKEAVEASINANRYLLFQGLDRDYRNKTVTINIYERIGMCTLQTLGVQYTIDPMGVAIEQTEDLAVIDGLIVVTGMRTTNCALGRKIGVADKAQLNVYQNIMYELNLLSYASQISELNVSDLDNLYLVSTDGMAVRLGDTKYIHAKILSLMTVKEELRKRGNVGGTVDVSTPVYPVYIP